MNDQEMFDGQEIVGYVASIPPMKLEAPESYQRGTYLTLKVEVRVRSVRYEEVTRGKQKGELLKVHVLATEDVKILGVLTPQDRRLLLEAAAAELVDNQGAPVEVPDGGPIEDAVATPISGSKSEPELESTAGEAWEYDEPEYVKSVIEPELVEAQAGF